MKRLSALFIIVLFPATLLAADKITLKCGLEPGQSWAFDQTQDSSATGTMSFNGKAQDISNKNHIHRAGKAVVVAAKDGLPTSIKFTFDDTCENIASATGQPEQKEKFAYAGTTVTIKRGDDGEVTDDFAGDASEAAIMELHGMMEQEQAIYPKDPVSVGDEWAADPKLLAKLVGLQGPDARAGMTLKLLSVKEIAGRPVAELKVSMAIQQPQPGVQIQVINQGTALIDIRTGHAFQMDTKGTLTIKDSGEQKGLELQGSGTTSSAMRADLNLADAPAPAPHVVDVPAGVNPLAPSAPVAIFTGKFSDGNLTLELKQSNETYAGTITLKGKAYPATATANDKNLNGSFTVGEARFPFTAKMDGQTLTLSSGGKDYTLKKAAPPAPANPLGDL